MISVCCSYFEKHLIDEYFISLEDARFLLWSLDPRIPKQLIPYTFGSGRVEQGKAWNFLRQLAKPEDFGILFTADDLRFPLNFLDRFLRRVIELDADIAAPAQTISSNPAWKIMQQQPQLKARRVSWVESTCLFIRNRALDDLLPFPEDSFAGWGADHLICERAHQRGKKIFIIDDCPIEHNWRPLSCNYDRDAAEAHLSQWMEANALSTPTPEVWVEFT